MFDSKIPRTVALVLTLGLCCGLAKAWQTDGGDSTAPPSEVETVDILNAKMPRPGVLVGGQPTPEHFEEAARLGYRTVVNLRGPGEKGSWDEGAKAAELGLDYVEIPVVGAEGISEENARAVAAVLDDPQNLPAMVHCGSGNRVGALFALMAFHLDGEDPEGALALGLDAGLTSLEPLVREKLQGAEKE